MKIFSPDTNFLDAAPTSEPLRIAAERFDEVNRLVGAVDRALLVVGAEQESMLTAAEVVGSAFRSKLPNHQFGFTAEQVAAPVAARPATVPEVTSGATLQEFDAQSAEEASPEQLPTDQLAQARALVASVWPTSEPDQSMPPEFQNA